MMKKFLFYLISIMISQWLAMNAWAENTILSQWIEIGPNNRWIARAITSGDTCPDIILNKKKVPMEIKNKANTHFPVTVCQAILPSDTTSAFINNHRLHLPKADPQKIVIIGDTGCELKENVTPQGCNDPRQWPFPLITKHAAAFKPDLVIHVGDYLYRESGCPAGNKECDKSPHGDNWAAWQADFFHPAAPLLKKAPWIFVRGNHEICERGGEGWTKLLDPFSFKHCFNHSPVYTVDIGNTRLFIIDSANADDITAPPEQIAWYQNYLEVVRKSPAQHNWIITHKPFWFVYKADTLTQVEQNYVTNTLQTAWLNAQLSNVALFVSGHLHRFQAINFHLSRPSQVIVGDSGTELDKNMGAQDLTGLDIANDVITQGLSLPEFGYLTMEKIETGWQAQVRNPHGKIIARCIFKEGQFICKKKNITIYRK
jgi:predicted phosphodiesterase